MKHTVNTNTLRLLLAVTLMLGLIMALGTTALANERPVGANVGIAEDGPVETEWRVGDSLNLGGRYFCADDQGTLVEQSKDAAQTVPEPKLMNGQWVFLETIQRVSGNPAGVWLTPPAGKTEADVPTGFRVKSGIGTQEDPYTFEPIYPGGTEWYIGDQIDLGGQYFYNDFQTDNVFLGKNASKTVPAPTLETYGGESMWVFHDTIPRQIIGSPASVFFKLPSDKSPAEVPLGFRVISGDGTQEDPYKFELIYQEVTEWHVGDQINLDGKYFRHDDQSQDVYQSKDASRTVPAPESLNGQWVFRDTIPYQGGSSPASVWLTPPAGKTETDVPTGFKVKSGDGTEANPYTFEPVYPEIVSVTGITLNKSETTITAGKYEFLTATVSPENATDKRVIWSSNNNDVAGVNDLGAVRAIAEGTATITATTADGGKTASCAVTVTKNTETVSHTVTFKVEGGAWDDGTTADKTVTLTGPDNEELNLKAEDIPAVGNNPDTDYKAGHWDVTPNPDINITENTTYTYSYAHKDSITRTITFKVAHGAWDDTTTGDKVVKLTGNEGDILKLSSSQIPDVGANPDEGYKAGSWDAKPNTTTPITKDATYYYTYAPKARVARTVTFKVKDGAWNDGTKADKTVTLTGSEGEELNLKPDDIPKVGGRPNSGYRSGHWDVMPDVSAAITEDTTYTYSYVHQDSISQTVTFKIKNGVWNDTTRGDKTVTLTGREGDKLSLSANQIPDVGNIPDTGYGAGSWDVTPTAGTPITKDITYTYTYAPKTRVSRVVTFKVAHGTWDDGTTADKTVTLTGYEGEELNLKAKDIPAVGAHPDADYKAGHWDVIPDTNAHITGDTTYTYSYAHKDSVSRTVTFKVANGAWDDTTTDDEIITLVGNEGDTLRLKDHQIPTAGTLPDEGYETGSWDVTPTTETPISENTTYTYTYKRVPTPTLYFAAHVQNDGWDKENKTLKPGQSVDVGTTGRGLRAEALAIMVPEDFTVDGFAHVQDVGDMAVRKVESSADYTIPEGYVAYEFGTTGKSRRLEAMCLSLKNPEGDYVRGFQYATHLQNYGWQGYVRNGSFAGTRGMSLRMEALRFAYSADDVVKTSQPK